MNVREVAARISSLNYNRRVGFTCFDVGCSEKILAKLASMNVLRLIDRIGGVGYYDVLDYKRLLSIVDSVGRLEIPKGLFDVIEGYEDVKRLIILTLKSEKPTHVLMVGPPGTAKTLFMTECQRIPGARYHLGSRSSKAGLTSLLLDEKPRILLIDEIDKMSPKDTSVLLSVMETGIVSETLFKRIREEKIDVRVIAACNSDRKLDKALISRFTVVRFQEYTPEEFARVAYRVLTVREGVKPELAMYIAESLKNITRDVRTAVHIGRRCRSRGEVDWMISRFYLDKVRVF